MEKLEKNLFVILFLLFTTLSLSSCGSSSSSKSNDSNKAGDAKSKIDLSPQIYDESKVIKVDIEIKESDWKLLAVQKKETEKMFVKSQGCPGPIPESAFT